MDEDIITEADLAEARERWADPSHESAVDDIFESPVYGKGFRGDNPVFMGGSSKPNVTGTSNK